MKKILVLALLLLASCASISQDKAESIAQDFVSKNVIFYAKEKNSTMDLPQFTIDSMTSYKEDNGWIVVMHITAPVVNGTKKNDITVKVDNSGKVIEFNGKRV